MLNIVQELNIELNLLKRTIFKHSNLVNVAHMDSKKQEKNMFVLKMHNNKINKIKQLLYKLVKKL